MRAWEQGHGGVPSVHLLGVPWLASGKGERVQLNRKDAFLLAAVAIGGSVERTGLAAMLWPSADRTGMLNNLRQRLHRLNRCAGAQVLPNAPRLTLDCANHDLAPLVGGVPITPDSALLELLAGCEFDEEPEAKSWLSAARERWLRLRVTALREAHDRTLATGRLRECMTLAKTIVDLDPWSEEAHRRVMTLHVALGERAAALQWFERFAAVLKREMNLAPSAATQAVARQLAGEERGPITADRDVIQRCLEHPPRLIGRAHAIEALEAGFAAHDLMVVAGEPGSGKTRLAAEFVARSTLAVAVGARWGDASQPYSLIARVLEALIPVGTETSQIAGRSAESLSQFAYLDSRFGAGPTTPLQVLRLARALVRQLDGIELVWIDDLQFADAASVDLLASIAAPGNGPRWLFCLRPREATAQVDQWLAAIAPNVTRADLAPWALSEVTELLDSLRWPQETCSQWATDVTSATGGNPLFVLRMLSLVVQHDLRPGQGRPMPDGMQKLLQAPLAGLSDIALALVRVAALSGTDFGLELAAAVLQQSPILLADPWVELNRRGLLREQRFVHDLTAEAVRAGIPTPVLEWMHAAIAAWLQASGAPSARVAPHWRRAAKHSEAAQQYMAAALLARTQARRMEEAELFDSAAACFDAAGQSERQFEALLERVAALVQSSAAEHAAAAEDLIQRAHGSRQRMLAFIAAAESFNARGELAWVMAHVPEALETARTLGDPECEAIGARRLAYAMVNSGQQTQAAALLDGLASIVVPRLDPGAQAEFFGDYGTVLAGADRRDEAAQVQQRAIEASWQTGRPSDAITGLANLAINHYFRGDLSQAERCLDEALTRPERVDQAAGLGLGMGLTYGQILRDLGRFGPAVEHLERALAGFREASAELWVVNSENSLAHAWLVLGQPARSRQLLAGMPGRQLPPFIQAARWLLLAQLAIALGESAQPHLTQGFAALREGDRPDVRFRLWATQCPLLDAQRATEAAGDWEVEATGREMLGMATLARAHRVAALLRADRAPEAAELALGVFELLPKSQPLAAYTPALWSVVAQACWAVGETEAARHAVRQAVQWIQAACASTPSEFRASFVERNPSHLALRRLALACGVGWVGLDP